MNGDVADTDPAAKHYLPQHDLHHAETYVSNEIFIDERSHLTDEYRTRARRFRLIDDHRFRLKR
jgi:hypothetical protein